MVKLLTKHELQGLTKIEMRNRVKILKNQEKNVDQDIAKYQFVIDRIIDNMGKIAKAFNINSVRSHLKYLNDNKNKLVEDKLSLQLNIQFLKAYLRVYDKKIVLSESLEVTFEVYNEELEKHSLEHDFVYQYEFDDEDTATIYEKSLEKEVLPAKMKKLNEEKTMLIEEQLKSANNVMTKYFG